ncbi:MAG: heavy metal sensor histidine kinase [Terricaulis sp.]
MSFVSAALDEIRRRRTVSHPPSLRSQVLIWFGASLCAAIGGVCVVLYFALIAQTNSIDDQLLEKKFDTLRGMISNEAERTYWIGHEVSEDMVGPRRVFVRVLGPEGGVLVETPDMAEVAPAGLFHNLAADAARPIFATARTAQRGQFRTLVGSAIWADGARLIPATVQIATDTSLDDGVLAAYRWALAVVAVVAAVLGLGAGWFWIARLLRPLEHVTDQVGALDLNQLGKPIETKGFSRELARLVHQHNAMMARLAHTYEGLQHYADNAAHELRTPLNKMLLELDIALRQSRSPEEYREAVSHAAQACRELRGLVERLLFLARVSARQTALQAEPFAVGDVLAHVVGYFEGPAEEAGVVVSLQMEEGIALSADRVLFQRAIVNLLSNAIDHTPKGGSVVISVCMKDGEARIVVRDTGRGIASEDLGRVFDRFYRSDNVRGAIGGHVGLGLSITKAIAELHGGRIAIESTLGRGTSVTIDLPGAVATEQSLGVVA